MASIENENAANPDVPHRRAVEILAKLDALTKPPTDTQGEPVSVSGEIS